MTDNKSNLIVTGLSGMIGSRFADLYGHKYNFTNIDLSTGVDITNKDQVDEAIKNAQGDIILHLAAFTDVDAANKQNGDKNGICWQVNVVGTQNIAEAAKKYNKYLIHASTDFVFSGEKKKPYTEGDPTDPIEWYGTTKAEAEKVIRATYDNWAILRLSFPFRGNYEPKKDLVRKIIDGLTNNTLKPMFTDHIITPTFVDDLCKVFFMFTLKRPKGVFHATGSSAVSDFELATIVKRTFELPGEIKEASLEEFLQTADRPYQKRLNMSNEKLQEELGNPMLPVESALQIMKTQM